jgi:hypothetical protein
MSLLESFLRSRGNLKEMERELGISYPTVRGRVDSLVRALGLSDGAPADERLDEAEADSDETEMASTDAAAARRDILERLARKEISAEDAATQLRGLGA